MSKAANYARVASVAILGVAGAISVGILTVMLNAWVLTYLWAWFVTPVFGLPQLGLASAAGIYLIVRYLTYQFIDEHIAWWMVFYPLAVLLAGYVISFFM